MKWLPALALVAFPLSAQMSVNWEHDFAAALKRAKAEKKQVFLDIWAEWCPPCQHLKNNVFPTKEAQMALMKYVPLSLMVEYKDRRPIAENRKVAEQFKVDGFPTLLILDENGKEVRREVGAFRSGADLAQWLNGK